MVTCCATGPEAAGQKLSQGQSANSCTRTAIISPNRAKNCFFLHEPGENFQSIPTVRIYCRNNTRSDDSSDVNLGLVSRVFNPADAPEAPICAVPWQVSGLALIQPGGQW